MNPDRHIFSVCAFDMKGAAITGRANSWKNIGFVEIKIANKVTCPLKKKTNQKAKRVALLGAKVAGCSDLTINFCTESSSVAAFYTTRYFRQNTSSAPQVGCIWEIISPDLRRFRGSGWKSLKS